ncbi:hypothetical protein ALC62_02389 [Cyphomyrmex costatus]|uniref:Uncharacterized protein n=1 Tax=Cyphomyrmex costatus TaxID=456900 RepID=A0A195D1E2_9HYME|nr:hypothetical protein ALC62_02389 [Cyphomyrmex costatus]
MSQARELTSSSSAAMFTPIADEVFNKNVESPLCLPEERWSSLRSKDSSRFWKRLFHERAIFFFKRRSIYAFAIMAIKLPKF